MCASFTLRAAVDLPNSLFVRNVPLDLADAKALEAELAKYGKLRSLALKKGFAFVEYYNMQDIEKALQASERKEVRLLLPLLLLFLFLLCLFSALSSSQVLSG